MLGKSILMGLTLACGYGTYYMCEQIHIPRAPAPVELSLGDQNRSESIDLGEISGYAHGGGVPHIIKYDLEFKDVPKTAWCEEVYTSKPTLTLQCTWQQDTEPRYATAQVEAPMPDVPDLSVWHFKRQTLQAVPEMQYWITVNFGYTLGTFIFGLLTFTFGLFALPEKKKTGAKPVFHNFVQDLEKPRPSVTSHTGFSDRVREV